MVESFYATDEDIIRVSGHVLTVCGMRQKGFSVESLRTDALQPI